MMFSLLLILCATTFVNAYDEDGWHYEWCTDHGCNISFDLAEGGVIEVMATDYDASDEHLEVYVDEEYFGDCNPGYQGRHDLWVHCTIPAGSIELRATIGVNYHEYTDESKGIVDAYVVIRIPTSLLGGISATIARMQEQITLLVQTNLQQAQEIQELKDSMANVVTRSEIDARFEEFLETPRTDLATFEDMFWLKSQLPEGKKIGTRIFRASTDGDSASDFHTACDNRGMTLLLVESTEGYRFGGFAGKPWSGSGQYNGPAAGEPRPFLFGLPGGGRSERERLDVIEGREHIAYYHHSGWGPSFYDLWVGHGCLSNTDSYTPHFAYNHPSAGQWSLAGGTSESDKYFQCEDYELYEIVEIE